MASFRTFYHGRMTGAEITCLQSFLDHGHDLRIFAYRADGIPPHFDVADAAAILPQSALFHHDRGQGSGSLAPFSDLFRYRLLQHERGCWWVDTDVACLRGDWSSPAGPIGAAWQDETQVCNAVLAAEPDVAAALERGATVLGQAAAWGQTGPGLLTLLVRERQLEARIAESALFYPLRYLEWYKPYLRQYATAIAARCATSCAVHLWTEMGIRHGFDRGLLPDPDSWFGRLVARHGTRGYFTER